MKPLGIAANLEKSQVPQLVGNLLHRLKRMKEKVLLEDGLAQIMGEERGFTLEEIGARCRLLIVLGGDGTVLRTARELYPHETPILAVNLGHLGFLATITPAHLEKVLPELVKGKGRTRKHSTLQVAVRCGRQQHHRWIALNDAVISRGAVSRVVELELYVDGEFLNSYLCDGIIFSTVTGSTAYSLSAGGPIVLPGASVYTITPICPHTLSNRSVIVGQESVVQARVLRQPEELFLGIDGQTTIRLKAEDRVEVSLSDYCVRMIDPLESSFYDLLRKKLRWSGSNL